MKYTLKDGSEIESIPIGRSSVKIGEISKSQFLTVCDRAPNETSNRGAKVICKCICGQYIVTTLNNIRNGHIKSCGCKDEEAKKMRGHNVGKIITTKDYSTISNPYYIFNKRLEEKNSNGFYWDVICKKCGKHYKEIPSQLISESRRKGNNPCQCWQHKSLGVLKIKQILQNNNIPYIEEKVFLDCLSPKGKNLKFDFFINNSYLIEYDGEQHTSPQSFGDKKETGQEKLKKQKEYDKIKDIWCKEKNIPLIRIPYTQYKNLKLQDLCLETSSFLIGV